MRSLKHWGSCELSFIELELVAQLVRESPLGLCLAESPRFDFALTINFLSVHSTSYCIIYLLYSSVSSLLHSPLTQWRNCWTRNTGCGGGCFVVFCINSLEAYLAWTLLLVVKFVTSNFMTHANTYIWTFLL